MISSDAIWRRQVEICRRFGVAPLASPRGMKVGLDQVVASGTQPLNGLRHPPEGDATGWYIWAGEELSQDRDYFRPVHVEHLEAICPSVLPYLALPAGWRFILAPDYEDVWEDATLLAPH